MANIVDIVFVDLVKRGEWWLATAFMHATDCEFTIENDSTDPSAAIRDLMRTVRRVQETTLALRAWQEEGVVFTGCTYVGDISRYVLTYGDSLDDYAQVCAITVPERSDGAIEIVPNGKNSLALEAEAILRDTGRAIRMIEEDEGRGLSEWLR